MYTDGPLWQEQHRFTMRQLRDLGFGKTSVEHEMVEEVDDLIKDIEESAKADPDNLLDMSTTF